MHFCADGHSMEAQSQLVVESIGWN